MAALAFLLVTARTIFAPFLSIANFLLSSNSLSLSLRDDGRREEAWRGTRRLTVDVVGLDVDVRHAILLGDGLDVEFLLLHDAGDESLGASEGHVAAIVPADEDFALGIEDEDRRAAAGHGVKG